MRVVRVLDRDGPAILEAILHLAADLLVREVGKKRERTLCEFHVVLQRQTAAVAVGTKSGVSVLS